MAEMMSDAILSRLKSELGFQRWEAIGHFLTDGDYLGFNEGDYWGAIAEYENAWDLLWTPLQKRMLGAEMLLGIADFALRSESPELAGETLGNLRPRVEEIANASLLEACEQLARLAEKKEED